MTEIKSQSSRNLQFSVEDRCTVIQLHNFKCYMITNACWAPNLGVVPHSTLGDQELLFVFTTILWDRCYDYLNFAGEEMDAQRSQKACPRSHSCWVAEEGFSPRASVSRVTALDPPAVMLEGWFMHLLWDSFSLESWEQLLTSDDSGARF